MGRYSLDKYGNSVTLLKSCCLQCPCGCVHLLPQPFIIELITIIFKYISVLIINVVVYIIIIMAAGLALVVLFTLATTNISERERELATIKVLGFYDAEVHLYVNKETLILTGIGILLGLPLGSVLGSALTRVLNLPSIYFAVTIRPVSYVYAAVNSIRNSGIIPRS